MTDLGKLLGRSLAFPPRVGAGGRMQWSEGEQNVRDAIRVILLTDPGERLLLPGFGAGLSQFLHEPNTLATRRSIAKRITEALAEWEARISVESVEVVAGDGSDRGSSNGANEAEPDLLPAASRSAVATVTYRLVATHALERVSLNVPVGGS